MAKGKVFDLWDLVAFAGLGFPGDLSIWSYISILASWVGGNCQLFLSGKLLVSFGLRPEVAVLGLDKQEAGPSTARLRRFAQDDTSEGERSSDGGLRRGTVRAAWEGFGFVGVLRLRAARFAQDDTSEGNVRAMANSAWRLGAAPTLAAAKPREADSLRE